MTEHRVEVDAADLAWALQLTPIVGPHTRDVVERLHAALPSAGAITEADPMSNFPEPTPLDPGYDISGDDAPSLWPLIRRAARWLQHPPRAANPTSPTEDA